MLLLLFPTGGITVILSFASPPRNREQHPAVPRPPASAFFFPSMSQQNVHQPTVATLPSGMHACAATIVRNPGNGHMSPAFGPARVPLVQTTLETSGAGACSQCGSVAAHHAAHRATYRAVYRAARCAAHATEPLRGGHQRRPCAPFAGEAQDALAVPHTHGGLLSRHDKRHAGMRACAEKAQHARICIRTTYIFACHRNVASYHCIIVCGVCERCVRPRHARHAYVCACSWCK